MPFSKPWNDEDDDSSGEEVDDGASTTLMNGKCIFNTGGSSSDSEDSFDRTPREKKLLARIRMRYASNDDPNSTREITDADNDVIELECLESERTDLKKSAGKKPAFTSPRTPIPEKDKIPALAGGLVRVNGIMPARENNYCEELRDDYCYKEESSDFYHMPTVYGTRGVKQVLEKINHLNPYCECFKPTKLTTQWRHHEREPDIRFGEHCE